MNMMTWKLMLIYGWTTQSTRVQSSIYRVISNREINVVPFIRADHVRMKECPSMYRKLILTEREM